jgi:hypothetical protein
MTDRPYSIATLAERWGKSKARKPEINPTKTAPIGAK